MICLLLFLGREATPPAPVSAPRRGYGGRTATQSPGTGTGATCDSAAHNRAARTPSGPRRERRPIGDHIAAFLPPPQGRPFSGCSSPPVNSHCPGDLHPIVMLIVTVHQFHWSRPPPAHEYVWPTVATLLALGLSFAAGWALVDPTQRSSDPVDLYAMWIIAPLSWLIPFFFWSMLVRKRRQFSERVPVLAVDDRGISTLDWRGKSLVFSWAEIIFERVQRGSSDDLLFRAGKTSGSISLKDLNRKPDEIVDIMNRCSKRAT